MEKLPLIGNFFLNKAACLNLPVFILNSTYLLLGGSSFLEGFMIQPTIKVHSFVFVRNQFKNISKFLRPEVFPSKIWKQILCIFYELFKLDIKKETLLRTSKVFHKNHFFGSKCPREKCLWVIQLTDLSFPSNFAEEKFGSEYEDCTQILKL